VGVDTPRRGPALATIGAVAFLTFLDTTIVSVALADVQSTLHAGVSQLQWVVNGYALVFAVLMLGAGTLGDRLGRKRVMLTGVAVFAAGSLLGALAPNVQTLIGARALMGLGAAACEPGTLSILRHLFPEDRPRARALGVWAALAGFALALGPIFGGLLVGLGGWRNVFWFNVAAAVAIFAVARNVVPESADRQGTRLDVGGLVLGPLALGSLTFAVILGETSGYGAPAVFVLFVASAVLTALFVAAESHSAAPVLDVRFLRRPSFSGALLVAFGAYFGIFSIFFFTALYLQVVVGYSGYRIAAVFVPMAAALIVASLATGIWVGRVGARVPMAVGCLLAGLGVLLTDLILSNGAGFLALTLSLALAGLGFGMAVVPVASVALKVVPSARSGMAASATMTSRELGTVLGVAVLGSLVNGRLTADLTRRLVALRVPAPFQKVVITAVETGQIPHGKGAAGAQAAYGPIVTKVIHATYDAFRSGLSLSLIVSGVMALGLGLVAWLAVDRCTRLRRVPHAGDGRAGLVGSGSTSGISNYETS
jgi:EmrB/QacA subfamily drug resistance transporter